MASTSGTDAAMPLPLPTPTPRRLGLLVALGALTAFGPMSLDFYLPAFPSVASSLGVAVGDVQLTFSACLLGLGLGQLVYGPLSDRYGRKPPLVAGLVLYVVASLLCALAPSLAALTALRLLQGLGGCAGIVIARAIVRDCYSGRGLARAFSVTSTVSMLAPLLAPTLGATILQWTTWRGIFAVIATFGLACLLVAWRLPETHPDHHRTDHGVLDAAREYVVIGRQRAFAVPASIAALGAATLFAYISSSPAVFIGGYGVSPAGFAGIFALLASVYVAGAQTNLRLVRRVDVHALLRAYLTASSLALVVLVVVTARHAPLAVVLAVLAVTKFCLGWILPNATAETMAPFARRAGSASALMGMAQMVLGALAAALLASLVLAPAVGMSGVMLVTSGLSLALTAVRVRRSADVDAA